MIKQVNYTLEKNAEDQSEELSNFKKTLTEQTNYQNDKVKNSCHIMIFKCKDDLCASITRMEKKIYEFKANFSEEIKNLEHRLAIDNPNLSSKINLITLSKIIEMIFQYLIAKQDISVPSGGDLIKKE